MWILMENEIKNIATSILKVEMKYIKKQVNFSFHIEVSVIVKKIHFQYCVIVLCCANTQRTFE